MTSRRGFFTWSAVAALPLLLFGRRIDSIADSTSVSTPVSDDASSANAAFRRFARRASIGQSRGAIN